MVEISLVAIGGKEVRYDDGTWELTGDVDVVGTGEHIQAEAKQVDDVRGRRARLRFDLETPPASLNPGDVGGYFESLERDGDRYQLVLKTDQRTYRYELNGIEYA